MKIILFTSLSGGNTAIKMSGIARYSRSLYKSLKKKESNMIFSLLETQDPPQWLYFLGKIIGKDIKTTLKGIPLTFSQQLSSDPKALLHYNSQTLAIPLLWQKRKSIVTVHDLIPIVTKSYTSLTERILYFFILKGLKRANHILADSEHTKKDLIKYADIPAEKITVVSLGIDHKEFYDKKKKREDNTILYIGSDAKRKNIEIILKALPFVLKEIPRVRFVKVGQAQDAKMREYLQKKTKEFGLEKYVIWKDYVENLREEYNQATLFVFPSLYEGFGFPVLEAMACGCPVICSNKTSLPEIAGDAALYFDGTDEKELAEKIIKVIQDKKLQETMRKRGLAQAKKFTWEKCAKKTMSVYQKFGP